MILLMSFRKGGNSDAKGYRLPTEAEWEYCARGGENYLHSGGDNIDEVVWYSGNSGRETHDVALKKANGYGLYDMNGNITEWGCDNWEEYTYGNVKDPYTNEFDSEYVHRGGCWRSGAPGNRVSLRSWSNASRRDALHGFRFLRTLP